MLSQKLKEYRNKNGLTQQDLAERLFVSRSAVAKWEQGKGIPNRDTLKSLCQMFECTKDELLNEDEAVEIIENVEKSSKKKTVILCAISIVLCIGLAVAVVIASFIYHNGKIICTTKSPDERIVLTVYDKPQSSGDVERGYTVKISGKYKGSWVKENCDFIGLYWSNSSKYAVEEFYSYDLNGRYFEYTDFEENRGVNLQLILDEKIKSYYSLSDGEITKLQYEFIRWDDETDIMLINFEMICVSSYFSGYFWSTPNLTDPLQGLVEIKKITN